MDGGSYLLLGFFVSAGLIAFLQSPARRLGWVDRPDTRKHHREPVPVIGGAAMYVAFSLALLLLPERPAGWEGLLAAMGILTAVGVYDDVWQLTPLIRFFFQGSAVLLTIMTSGLVISQLGDLFGLGAVVMLGIGAVYYTIFCLVGVINAFNMSDGIDGLAGGYALVATVWLIVLTLIDPGQHQADLAALVTLAAAIMGFLVYNLRNPWRSRASVFMGDAGSTMLGLIIGWFLIRLSQGGERVMLPMTAVWILAVPLLDMGTVMIRRFLAGRSPVSADRQHLHHLLLAFGWSDGRVTAMLLVVAVATGELGAVAWWLGVPDYVQFYVFIALFLVYYQKTARIWAQLAATPTAHRWRLGWRPWMPGFGRVTRRWRRSVS